MSVNVAVVVGSLRKDSFTRKVAKAAIALLVWLVAYVFLIRFFLPVIRKNSAARASSRTAARCSARIVYATARKCHESGKHQCHKALLVRVHASSKTGC